MDARKKSSKSRQPQQKHGVRNRGGQFAGKEEVASPQAGASSHLRSAACIVKSVVKAVGIDEEAAKAMLTPWMED